MLFSGIAGLCAESCYCHAAKSKYSSTTLCSLTCEHLIPLPERCFGHAANSRYATGYPASQDHWAPLYCLTGFLIAFFGVWSAANNAAIFAEVSTLVLWTSSDLPLAKCIPGFNGIAESDLTIFYLRTSTWHHPVILQPNSPKPRAANHCRCFVDMGRLCGCRLCRRGSERRCTRLTSASQAPLEPLGRP